MKHNSRPTFSFGWLELGIVTFCFWLSYTQWPLYSEIQPTYFTRGVAVDAHNLLQHDLLGWTVDPWPLFTSLVELTRLSGFEQLFSVYHFVVAGAYICGLVLIGWWAFLRNAGFKENVFFVASLVLVHSAFLGDLTRVLLGRNIFMGTYLGVANQSLMGVLLAPSVIGVLIILSIGLFLQKRMFAATILLAIPGLFHISHVISTAPLLLVYCYLLWRKERAQWWRLLEIVLIWVVVISPQLLYTGVAMKDLGGDISQRAREIAVTVRLPHHADPRVWLNGITFLQVIFLMVGMWLTRKQKDLFLILFVPASIGFVATALYIVTGWLPLGLIQPWRLSTYLMPIVLALVLSWAVGRWVVSRRLTVAIVVFLLLSMFYGVVDMLHRWHDFGREEQQYRDLVTGLRIVPGETVLIPDDLKHFRLATGFPVVVDFKSPPFRDREWIEWGDRLERVRGFYANPEDCSQLKVLEGLYGVRYVVFYTGSDVEVCSQLVLRRRLADFVIYVL